MREDSKKQVSVGWQCLATLLLPTGIYAFKRIGKLRFGIMIYSITNGVWLGIAAVSILISASFDYNSYLFFNAVSSAGVLVLSFLIPIWYMNKWTTKWNKESLLNSLA